MDKGAWQTTVHRSQRVGHNGRKLARMHTNTEQDEKAKIYETERWTTQVSRCPVCYLENSGEITPERMKRQSQIENNTQLWMWLVMEVKKVPCCEEQYCIGIWNVRFMNQGKLEVAKKKTERVNINILGISELKWSWWVNSIQMAIISITVGKNSLEAME